MFIEFMILKMGVVKPQCLYDGWQTSGSVKVVRMAFNLHCNGMPSVSDYEIVKNRLRRQSVMDQKNCFAAVMHHIFGKQYRFVIQSMQYIIINYMQCLEGWINVKDSINGNEERY